jgi:hypothetical protein
MNSALAVLAESTDFRAALRALTTATARDAVAAAGDDDDDDGRASAVPAATERMCQALEAGRVWKELGASLVSLPLSPDPAWFVCDACWVLRACCPVGGVRSTAGRRW